MSDSCHICYEFEDELFICDKCENFYCYECSYSYTIHYQYEGQLCCFCADQFRRKMLTITELRDRKIKLYLHEEK